MCETTYGGTRDAEIDHPKQTPCNMCERRCLRTATAEYSLAQSGGVHALPTGMFGTITNAMRDKKATDISHDPASDRDGII